MEGIVLNKHIKLVSVLMSLALLVSVCEVNKIKVSAEDRLVNLRKQQVELNRQQKNLNSRLEKLKNNINKKKEYRNSVLAQMRTLQEQIDVECQKIEILDSQIARKQAQIDQVQVEIDQNLDVLCERLKAIYKAGDVPELAIFIGVKSFNDFLDTAEMIQKLSKFDAELIEDLEKSIYGVQQEKELIEKDKNEVCESKSILDSKRQELNNLQQENERVIVDLRGEEIRIQSRINKNNARKRNIENRISRFGGRGKITSVPTVGGRKGRYVWPVPGYGRISSGWGDGRRHNGIDIPAPKGTKVVAMADGVVVAANVSSSWGSGWGYHVRINHGDGYETMSAHLSKVLVNPGQPVKAGQVIGLVGNTGHSFGNHLHCGTAKNGRWYNPRNEL